MNTFPGLRWLSDANEKWISKLTVRSNFDEMNIIRAYEEDQYNGVRVLGVPRYFEKKLKITAKIPLVVQDHRDLGPPIHEDVRFVGQLRESQQEIDNIFQSTNQDHGVIVLGCGKGKTAMAIYLITERFRRRALYVVHKDILFKQTCDEIALFAPNANIGTICQDRVHAGPEKDIVVAMLQSLCMHKYDPSVYANYGVVIVDEAHRICSNVFSRLLPKLTAAVRIGLSATPERKDGMTPLLRWHIGPNINQELKLPKPIKEPEITRLVVMFRLDYENTRLGQEPTRATPQTHAKKMAQRSILLKRITLCKPRETFVERLLCSLYDETQRNIIAFSHQIKHLHNVYQALCRNRDNAKNDAAKYYGSLKEQARTEAKSKRVILATYAIASEGFNIPRLDTLFFMTPGPSDPTQNLGRIEREYPNKVPLLVYDIWDDLGTFSRGGWNRRRVYIKRGYEVIIEDVIL